MMLGKVFLLSLLLATIYCQPTSVGYYFDKASNLVQVPVAQLPVYLLNDSVIAVASYFDRLNTTGWTFFQASSNPKYADYQQMYAAGYIEGSATYDLIWDAWNNFNDFMLNGAGELPGKAQEFVTNQTKWMTNAIALNPQSHYFQLLNATLNQLYGLYEGYIHMVNKTQREDMFLTFDQFYFLTNMGDLEDVIPAFDSTFPKMMECSCFIKLTPDDLLSGHTTFNMYTFMLRLMKSYHFPLNNPLVKVKTLMFSARPGDLESKDDFYTLDNNLVVVETSLNNYNKTNYDYLNYNTVPCWLRLTIANRISSTGQEWANAFLAFRSGTHNNQWLVVDYNKYATYKNNMSAAEGIVWMAEEFYFQINSKDVTQELLVAQGYVAGYNVPYGQSIYDVSGYDQGYNYNYTSDPRAKLFKKYASNVTNLDTIKELIRHNNVSDTDSPCVAISPRCDLLEDGPSIFGAIDGKALNSKMVKTMTASIISGPTTQGQPAFSWNNWQDQVHRGMPATFDFDWLLYEAIVGPLPSKVEEKVQQQIII